MVGKGRAGGAAGEPGRLRHPLRLLGFGYFQTWIYLAVMSPTLFAAPLSGGSRPWMPLALSGLLVVSMALCVLVNADRPFAGRREVALAGSAAAGAGTVLLALSGGSDALLLAALALVDAGKAVLMMGWGALWARIDLARMAGHLTVSCVFSGVLYFALAALPPWMLVACLAALPLASALTLARCSDEPERAAPAEDEELTPPMWKAVAALVVVPVAYSLIRSIFAAGPMELLGESYRSVMAAYLAFAVLLAVFVGAHEPPRVGVLYRGAVTLLLFGFISFLALPSGALGLASAATMMGYSLFSELVWLIRPSVEVRVGGWRGRVFGWGRLLLHASALAGLCLGSWLTQRQGDPAGVQAAAAPVAATVMTILIVVLAINILSEKDFIQFASPLRVEKAGGRAASAPTPSAERSLDAACAAVAGRHGLSEREGEVLGLLTRGRSLPYIEEALSISNSTARTHARNIYRKLDIHFRQALINLVESEGKEEAGVG